MSHHNASASGRAGHGDTPGGRVITQGHEAVKRGAKMQADRLPSLSLLKMSIKYSAR